MKEILQLLRQDRFRTLLSVLGVSIGVFIVVMALTLITALKQRVRQSMDALGGDVLYVQRFPLVTGDESDWWRLLSRPHISRSDFVFVRDNLPQARTSYSITCRQAVSSQRRTFREGTLVGASGGWNMHCPAGIGYGRELSDDELQGAPPLCAVGAEVAEALDIVPGRKVRIGDRRLTCVGVYSRQGVGSPFITDMDAAVVVPVKIAAEVFPPEAGAATIAVSPASDDVSADALEEDLKRVLRLARRVRPESEDNFSVNRMSMISSSVEDVMRMLRLTAWIIGGFSLLVGAFGIANIMFVSVRERMPQTGLKKALGASRRTIMKEFLTETAVLSLLGASAALLAVFLCTLPTAGSSLPLSLSLRDALSGLLAALATGMAAGCAPAMEAARMNPSVSMTAVC